ncbi:DUF6760 family protein [Anabaena azotica]|uniref:DUF6760 domain-containing protein n=1 Tax=Anabaena azotica FACHB-119 TaxID=947527 RepID=A0ABR8D9D0_9NOST|nr:DUF6760 family protein [Anabaena azotica]MBD2503808.1 hypothetical protein [Anabaena azotica FACHB-119]
MSSLSAGVGSGARPTGGIIGYPLSRLYEEVAYLAYHFHWSYEQLIVMEHSDRLQWVAEVAKINQRFNEPAGRFELE